MPKELASLVVTMEEVYRFLSLATILQAAVFMAAIEWNRSVQKEVKRPLILYLAFNLLCFANFLLVTEDLVPSKFYFFYIFSLFLGPLVYDIVRSPHAYSKGRIKKYIVLVILSMLLIVIRLSGETFEQLSAYFDHFESAPGIGLMLFFGIKSILYLSNNWPKQPLPFRFLGIIFLISAIGSTAELILEGAFDLSVQAVFALLFFTTALIINGLIFLIMKAGTVYESETKKSNETKYSTSSLNVEESRQLAEKLTLLMERDLPFRNADLNLNQVAELIHAKAHHVSQVINSLYQKRFPEYINDLRVEDAARLFQQKPDLTVKEVMYTSGFKSKSSFNSNFKRLKGSTPSEFRIQYSGTSL